MIASSILTIALAALAALAGSALAQPLDARADTISCSKDSTVGLLKYHQAAYHRSLYNVFIHVSDSGQQQLGIVDGALKVRGRKCKSSHLGLTYDDNDGTPGSTQIFASKFFLFDDESKCIQRHSALHASGPRKTHIVVEDCLNADGKDQARQFWLTSGNFSSSVPYYKKSDREKFGSGVEKVDDRYLLFESLDYSNNNFFKIL